MDLLRGFDVAKESRFSGLVSGNIHLIFLLFHHLLMVILLTQNPVISLKHDVYDLIAIGATMYYCWFHLVNVKDQDGTLPEFNMQPENGILE